MPPFLCSLPVRFADVDHAGIVYYPRFFHYFHLAFEELWRARLGAHAYRDLLDKEKIGFPAVRAACDFHAPLRFGDTADLELSISRMGGKSIEFHYRVLNATQLCAEGTVTCAVVDLARFAAIAIPERVKDLLRDLAEAY
jgi:4-hydroxybenzoyl-CoA thioesterase